MDDWKQWKENVMARSDLDAFTKELLLELPDPQYTTVDTDNAMFRQWYKILNACSNPDSVNWHLYGARGAYVYEPWYDFGKFIEDMGPSFEIDPSKPPMLRRNFLARKSLTGGFTPKNAVWVNKREMSRLQSRSIIVDTPFGRKMTLRDLAQYLQDHEGEDWPDGREYTIRVREPSLRNPDKLVTVNRTISTIQPVHLLELRKRHRAGKDLFKPTRPYGDTEDRIENERFAIQDQKRNELRRKAEAAGMTPLQYAVTYGDD